MPEQLFHKKPVQIAAIQLTRDTFKEVLDWAQPFPGGGEDEHGLFVVIRTLEGDIRARGSDWVIRGVAGEFYPCRADIFERTYEPVGSLAGDADSPTPQQILAVPMGENDADAATVRDYLIKLLAKVWLEGEGFDGKRPFGNSGWDGEIATALVRAGFVEGEIDEDGYLDGADYGRVEALVLAAIESLGAVDA